MRKIFYIVFLFFVYLSSTFASNDIKIISRAEWGADENIRFNDSLEWINIFKQREKQSIINKDKVYTKAQIDAQNAANNKSNKIDEILVRDFSEQLELSDKITTENGRKLYWPIQIAKNIKGIVIHHTSTNYPTSLESVRNIYRYHTLDKQWGDIGYNYLIGKDGEIFEGRAGGDNVVAAHNKYNNTGDIGIALIGDYSENSIDDKQYQALKSLTSYLVNKYQIDLTKKVYFHQECNGKECIEPILSELEDPIIGHRDAGHTTCPGEKLYKQIQELKSDLLKEPKVFNEFNPVSTVYKSNQLKATLYKTNVFKVLKKIPDEKLIDLLAKMEEDLENVPNINKSKLKDLIIEYFKEKSQIKKTISKTNNYKINVKLSYPDNDKISIKVGTEIFDITREGNEVVLNGKKTNVLNIPNNSTDSILEITTWQRKPSWDMEGQYNDNKFRGEFIIYVKDEKLVVVNKIDIEDYLKGLGEVSDTENPEKIKTIITSARSYATWYITKAKKFPGELYDGVDDPEVFQKYIGYGLEARSPNINKIVDETKGQIITFKGDLIKPWYFSNSNGKTLSYYDYCLLRNSGEICKKEAEKYPFLQSVVDKGSSGKVSLGHGVGISGAGVKYFAQKGWTYDMIIKYYLKGVDIL